MSKIGENPVNWKGISSENQAKNLIDRGILLTWKDARQLKKNLSAEDQRSILKYMAVTLAERVEGRLPEEILIEGLLIMLVNSNDDDCVDIFLGELFRQPNREEAFMTLVKIAVTSDISEVDHEDEIFSMAVALICELGLAIHSINREYPDEIRSADKLLSHVTTYLLSVSNSNNNCIRLSLINYFGKTENNLGSRPAFNRILGRFGHTILEHLFSLLFTKKTEAIALQYLLENIPFVLEADNESQKILHETWKYYMLKKPERFSLFMQILSHHIRDNILENDRNCRKVFLQHLAILLKVASDINHRNLGREIIKTIALFSDDPFQDELIEKILKDHSIRKSFQKLLMILSESSTNNHSALEEKIGFRSSRRGRKPSFAKTQEIGTIHQITYLGHKNIAKVS